jgi:hypothetical protein
MVPITSPVRGLNESRDVSLGAEDLALPRAALVLGFAALALEVLAVDFLGLVAITSPG